MNTIIEKKTNEREAFVRWMCFTWERHIELQTYSFKLLDKMDQRNNKTKDQLIEEMEEKY